MISILITTHNEAVNILDCLDSVAFCDDIVVLDSNSSDDTAARARNRGVRVYQRTFDDYSSNLNFALTHIAFRHPFVFLLDADERVSPQLSDTLRSFSQTSTNCVAFRVRRRDFFLERELRHVQTTPLYIRLFRPERVRFTRLVHQQAHIDGPIGDIEGLLDHYPFSKGVAQWRERHQKYAELEASQYYAEAQAHRGLQSLWQDIHQALFSHDFHERRKAQKRIFSKLPARHLIRFAYFMILKAGFLDGWPGIKYIALMSWYEYRILIARRQYTTSAIANNANPS